eukprot:TRINITY_DN9577_c0_g1::TRINITY_DN9577_c0_g1_i1::g.12259::m.12259 TRINITY_DN9577_c0_g1::TRINITY_DN9577_c0_g1_i1::g.12259  ORF type:complete len:331 (-),score=10.39,sp/Q8IW45/NNRD_HUMAN/42.37/1e-85,Carb_kinase/PF01256.12/6.4e-45 TRINITY_DN9577_c0_g1_i1:15-1007(-)
MEKVAGILRQFVPPLTSNARKGEMGRVGIFGGSKEYTGAPYFSAISSLKLGADLSFVMCADEAAYPLKSYSPELMVYPVYDRSLLTSKANVDFCMKNIEELLPRIHTLVIGPGLGRNEHVQALASNLVKTAISKSMPLVLDADGLCLVTENISLLHGYNLAVITPNEMEYQKIAQQVFRDGVSRPESIAEEVRLVSQRLGNVLIVKKGQSDIITDGNHSLVCSETGGLRRCGGQGDILTGFLAVLNLWAHRYTQSGKSMDLTSDSEILKQSLQSDNIPISPYLIASWFACALARKCSAEAYKTHKRSMTSADILSQIGPVFDSVCPAPAL